MPVYDARFTIVNFDSDLPALEQRLPKFTGEVPSGSFVVVGYSVSDYVSKGETHVSFSVLWVMVCGVPIQG